MKMARALLLLSAITTAAAAPAIVWKSGFTSPQHSSESIRASSLLESTLTGAAHDSSSLAAVVFVVAKDKDGYEFLSHLASSGALPQTESKYESAHSIHHHVEGVESGKSIARDARAGLPDPTAKDKVVEMTLSEFSNIVTSSEKNVAEDVLVVNVGNHDDASVLDAAVIKAVEHSHINSVVLTAQRSVEEVKRERTLARRRNKVVSSRKQVLAPRRRLEEDNNDNQNNNNNQNNDDDEVVYYVNMTPNIFAGVMFTFFFIYVSHLGINCMGMITNSDVFASKLPSVGREV